MYALDTPWAAPSSSTASGRVLRTWSYTIRPWAGDMKGTPSTAAATAS